MIQWSSIQQYRKQYPDDSCAYDAVGYGEVLIECRETGEMYRSPSQETDEEFLDRLSRCRAANRNLFYEEWEKMLYNPNLKY